MQWAEEKALPLEKMTTIHWKTDRLWVFFFHFFGKVLVLKSRIFNQPSSGFNENDRFHLVFIEKPSYFQYMVLIDFFLRVCKFMRYVRRLSVKKSSFIVAYPLGTLFRMNQQSYEIQKQRKIFETVKKTPTNSLLVNFIDQRTLPKWICLATFKKLLLKQWDKCNWYNSVVQFLQHWKNYVVSIICNSMEIVWRQYGWRLFGNLIYHVFFLKSLTISRLISPKSP